ncbi:MAG: hypothetical protein PWQ57_754 [Desulfovibrionales bacterium]|nr:hypothetical protein [Desulfovibrionales bacterium]
MATIMPQGELARKAVAWISDQQQESERKLSFLIDDAAMRFNLGPKDVEFLIRFFEEQSKED